MARHATFRKPRRAARELRNRDRRQAPRARGRHRASRTVASGTWRFRSRTSGRLLADAGLVLAFVLSLLGGVQLSMRGPAEPSGDRPAVSFRPQEPAGPGSTRTEPSRPAIPEQPTKPKAEPPGVRKHTVRPGDTLWELARTYGTTTERLQRLNGLGHSTLISAGHTLRVPAEPGATAR
ncbi:LysM peptidoglycan-binding domain-containing protein [Streptomyces sp. NPDC057539]|uniref:LysM peptidoglycan-binding domain-containing protein n=1 Tax=Streptomyces sp. NPDC057539 TaxID=3346159 RepID=UPI00367BF4FB